ncbi:AbrB/MazE/SpoVT family DNA-binding domain-containing protein [Anaerotruncus rubiinfantis]|uniref:AbrB/MazE/SpoVT family DNA-binding domain-containing protein n=1 Tax=Anaerotruncus rubiinfantis TaxID=1720200 RepID=UPI00082CC997|nr:hypothetical protein [Anaerotruncus rubiinfantis]
MKNHTMKKDFCIPAQFLDVAGLSASAGGTMMTIAPGVIILMNPIQDDEERREVMIALRKTAFSLRIKSGDSCEDDPDDGFHIPSYLLREAGIDPNKSLDVVIDDGSLIISPAQNPESEIFPEDALLQGVSLLRTLGMPLGLIRRILREGADEDAV